jgi:hypothetical protein
MVLYKKEPLIIILYHKRSINKTYCFYKPQYNYVLDTYIIYVAKNAGKGQGMLLRNVVRLTAESKMPSFLRILFR